MLSVERTGSVLHLVIQRPEVRNAFDDHLIAALRQAFLDLPAGIRAVVLRGEGKAFCAGGDLEWMRRAAHYTREQNEADALALAGLFQAVAECPAVVIAQVHGFAFGGGAGLVSACDVAIAAEGTQFSFSEVKLGLVPATISPYVVKKIGPGHARALFVTGHPFDAEHALRIGLVHRVVPTEGLVAAVDETIRTVLKNGPEAVATSKWLAQQPPLANAAAAALLAEARARDEGKAGIAAFLEKRPADFVEDWTGSA